MGGCLAVVAHAFGDYGERDAFGFGSGSPAVAGYVEGQRDCYSYHYGDTFQAVVDVVACVAVGASLVESGIANDGHEVAAFVFGILVEYRLHLLSPFDDELLTGLAAPVGDVAVFEV